MGLLAVDLADRRATGRWLALESGGAPLPLPCAPAAAAAAAFLSKTLCASFDCDRLPGD